jgi:hypothetical protein
VKTDTVTLFLTNPEHHQQINTLFQRTVHNSVRHTYSAPEIFQQFFYIKEFGFTLYTGHEGP